MVHYLLPCQACRELLLVLGKNANVVGFERSQITILCNVYTINYLSHCTVQYRHIWLICSFGVIGCNSSVTASKSESTSRVAHSVGSGKLYICLSNKYFNGIQHIRCVTDVTPHRITGSYVYATDK